MWAGWRGGFKLINCSHGTSAQLCFYFLGDFFVASKFSYEMRGDAVWIRECVVSVADPGCGRSTAWMSPP